MRDSIVDGLNELLEIDHNAVAEAMTLEIILSIDSDLGEHPVAYTKEGVQMINALAIISQCGDFEPILPVFENGIIQRFE